MMLRGTPSAGRKHVYGRIPLETARRTPSRLALPRSTALLVTITIFALGLVLGAMLFGQALLTVSNRSETIEQVIE